MADHDPPPAGPGDDPPSRSEVRLELQAIAERWPMSAAVRVAILKRLANIVDPDNVEGYSTRLAIAASRALLAADALNVQRERLALARELKADRPAEDRLTTDLIAEADAIRRRRAGMGAGLESNRSANSGAEP